MIVARIEKITGSCAIPPHYIATEGWFPVNSFNFGFNSIETPENTPAAPPAGASAGASAGRSGASTGAGASAGGATKKKEDFTGMTLTKYIDAATCWLMFTAMQARMSKKGSNRTKADIHVISSVMIEQKRFIYPSLMIHLENVLVQQWSINGSGDERPEEEITLMYDKAAINYRGTPTGGKFQDFPPGGTSWDQKEQAPFKYDGFKKYLNG